MTDQDSQPIDNSVPVDSDGDSITRSLTEAYNAIQSKGVETVRAEREAREAGEKEKPVANPLPEYRPSKHDISTEEGLKAELAQNYQRFTALDKAREAANPSLPWKSASGV